MHDRRRTFSLLSSAGAQGLLLSLSRLKDLIAQVSGQEALTRLLTDYIMGLGRRLNDASVRKVRRSFQSCGMMVEQQESPLCF